MRLLLSTLALLRRLHKAGACGCYQVTAFAALFSCCLSAQESQRFYIREYRVDGAKRLKTLEVEEAVYRFLGPARTPEHVEQARQSLEKAYHDKGFQTVSVLIPQQDPRRGIIRLEVVEGKIARLRVNGARWFLPSRIKREVPSVAEGSVPNLDQVGKEIIAVNRLADRRITPELRLGVEPGTIEIDLNVEDKMPLHGSFELNNRYSADTSSLRLNGALSYGNLFQMGHTLGANVQIAPENIKDGLVYSGYYLARVSDRMSIMLNATRQDSDVSTLGGAAVAGKGEIIGIRAMVDLPTTPKFYQSANFGIDYKNFTEDIIIGTETIAAPIEYYPLSANYAATWMTDQGFTEFNSSLNLHLRGMGSDTDDYANKRYNSSGNFIYLRSDAAHTQDINGGSQWYGKVQGQISGQPLINNEQTSIGGLGTVRGYLEATALGDNGIFGTFEIRSPSLIGKVDATGNSADEWRFHAFADAGLVGIYDALPGQKKRAGLSSAGFGTRVQVREHYHGSLDIAVPFIEQTNADDGEVRVTFRSWADF